MTASLFFVVFVVVKVQTGIMLIFCKEFHNVTYFEMCYKKKILFNKLKKKEK